MDPFRGGNMNTGTETVEPRELMPGLNRYTDGSKVRITFRWFNGVGRLINKLFEALILLFGIVVVVVAFDGVMRSLTGAGNFSLVLIDSFFFLAGLILVYRGLMLLVNQSTFEISDGNFSVRHGPLPGTGNLNLAVYEISGVEWQKEGQTRNSGFSGTRLAAGYSAVFNVVLITSSGKKITLVSGIHAREYAFALSSEISNAFK
jgi:hypothetical protein